MRKPVRRLVVAGVAIAVLAAVGAYGTAGGGPVAYADTTATTRQAAGAPHRWVTLVTGDRVLVRLAGQDEQVVTVRPAKGREGARFLRQVERGDTYVIPADVAPLVAAKRVDRRLFNVSKLVEFGYDDSRRGDVPLIVTYDGGASAQSANARVRDAGGKVSRRLPSIAGDAVTVSKGDTTRFWRAVHGSRPHTLAGGVARVWLDGKVRASLDQSVPQIGAPTAWQAGHTGRGAKVAVLDTGVDTNHPDLADAVTGAQDFTGSESGTADKFGHGTHVAGIITGNGTKYKGVAPDATILNGKVLDDTGSGAESWIIAGMEWAAAQGVDVINMSLGSALPSDGTDPMSQAVNQLTRDTGALFVVAAGNSGPGDKTIGSPAAADAALTVGAVDRQDNLAEFSSRGPRWNDLAIKPDITAPGVDIVAPLADGSLIGDHEPVVDGRYVRLSGTSMATPHVAGAAAILAAQHPDWTADKLKSTLMNTARPHPDASVYAQGAGRVNVARAVTQTITASPASLSLGIQRWPHHDDKPISKTITYRNDGTEPVTLQLTVDVHDPSGKPAPSGMFTLDKQQLVVPAGGTASATLTTHTSVSAPDGTYGGTVTATAGQTTVHTPVGVTREVESYDVTVTVLDRTGTQTPEYWLRFVNVTQPEAAVPYDPSGKIVARVPKGTYYLETDVHTPDSSQPWGWNLSLIVEPHFVVDGATTLVLDARDTKPTSVTVDQPSARSASAVVAFDRDTSFGGTGLGIFTSNFDGIYVRPSRTTAPAGAFTYSIGAELAEPDGNGGFADSPYLYHVVRETDARVPTELAVRVPDRELAKVTTTIAATQPDHVVLKDFIVERKAPATITEYYTPDRQWEPFFSIPGSSPQGVSVIESEPVSYQLSKSYVERWNVGVFGPSFAYDAVAKRPTVAREGDTIAVIPMLYGDQAPNRNGHIYDSSFRLMLYRNGELIGDDSARRTLFTVPAKSADYRLVAEATQDTIPLSTKISAAWTFRSAHTDELRALPMQAVRFAPPLDDHNRAKAGTRFTFPVYVQRQPGASYGTLSRLDVQVSYDDGKTWQPVRLTGTGLNRTAIVDHPNSDGFVSLKATAADSNGNTVEQTVIRAYALHT